MLTSNAQREDGSIIPTMNFSVPLKQLAPIIEIAKARIRGSSALLDEQHVYDAFDAPQPLLRSLWDLNIEDAENAPNEAMSRL